MARSTKCRKEVLGVPGGFDALHLLLPLPGGLMGILCTIVE
jgi:hypothetical protein